MNLSTYVRQVQAIESTMTDCNVVHHGHVGASADGRQGMPQSVAVEYIQTSVGDVDILQERQRSVVEEPLRAVVDLVNRRVVELYTPPVVPGKVRTQPHTLETYHLLTI